jgi:hypothetical protein
MEMLHQTRPGPRPPATSTPSCATIELALHNVKRLAAVFFDFGDLTLRLNVRVYS